MAPARHAAAPPPGDKWERVSSVRTEQSVPHCTLETVKWITGDHSQLFCRILRYQPTILVKIAPIFGSNCRSGQELQTINWRCFHNYREGLYYLGAFSVIVKTNCKANGSFAALVYTKLQGEGRHCGQGPHHRGGREMAPWLSHFAIHAVVTAQSKG